MPAQFVISYYALWLLVVLQTLILLGVTRALYDMRRQSWGAQPGRRVPQFSVVDLSGRDVSAASLVGAPAVLLFVSPSCQSCMLTLDELKALASDGKRGLTIVCEAEDEDCRRLAATYQLTASVVPDGAGTLRTLFGVPGLPAAVRIDANGVIESYGRPARGKELEEILAGLLDTDDTTTSPREQATV